MLFPIIQATLEVHLSPNLRGLRVVQYGLSCRDVVWDLSKNGSSSAIVSML